MDVYKFICDEGKIAFIQPFIYPKKTIFGTNVLENTQTRNSKIDLQMIIRQEMVITCMVKPI